MTCSKSFFLAVRRNTIKLRHPRRNSDESKKTSSPLEYLRPGRGAVLARRNTGAERLSHGGRSGQDSRCREQYQRAHPSLPLLRRGSLEEIPIRVGASFDEPPRGHAEFTSQCVCWVRR